jgi:hypothetical protein
MKSMGPGDPIVKGLTIPAMESLIMKYSSFEIGLRGMSPTSIRKVYLGGIGTYFVQLGVRNYFQEAVASKHVRCVLRGYEKIYSVLHPASGG